jgi:hypothetical protein
MQQSEYLWFKPINEDTLFTVVVIACLIWLAITLY